MAKTVTLGSANPLTVTSLAGGRGGTEIAFIYLEDGMDKNCSKRPLESSEHKNGEDSNFRSG